MDGGDGDHDGKQQQVTVLVIESGRSGSGNGQCIYPGSKKRRSHNNDSCGGDNNMVVTAVVPLVNRLVVASIWMVGSGVAGATRIVRKCGSFFSDDFSDFLISLLFYRPRQLCFGSPSYTSWTSLVDLLLFPFFCSISLVRHCF